jgi:hypothetical protein
MMSKSLLASWNATQTGCKKCGGEMVIGQALENNLSGIPDFIGDKYPVTVSPDGTAKLISCLKCKNCGWSVRIK